MNRKPRILLLSEFSASYTGYAKISKEILTRLYNTGKYELAELAAYCQPNDSRINDIPWKVYPILPDDKNQEEIREYNSHPCNANGRHKFNHVCLDFQPDHVICTKDNWYEPFVHTFPFRHLYNLIWYMPIDGLPQRPEWIADAIQCQGVFTYTEWGTNVLKQACGNQGNILAPLRPGVNTSHFFPIPQKKLIKQHFGYEEDILIVGFVARNQYRKQFDELFRAFTHFLINGPKELTSKTYLYIHSAWPDLGIDFPQLLMEYGISNKVLFTYHCKNCQHLFPSVYADTLTVCPQCNQGSAFLPKPSDVNLGEDKLNLIYNFFDVYVQLASNEGIGIPCVESIACAVPTMCGNHSGMTDVIKYGGAIPIESIELRRENELHRLFAVPDIEEVARKLVDILSLPDSLRRKLGWDMYLRGKEVFNWDKGVNQLIPFLDSLPLKQWNIPQSRLHRPNINIPPNLTNEQFVQFLYYEVLGRPELYNSYDALKIIYSLSVGWTGRKPNFAPFNRDIALHNSLGDNNFHTHWETIRLKKFGYIK